MAPHVHLAIFAFRVSTLFTQYTCLDLYGHMGINLAMEPVFLRNDAVIFNIIFSGIYIYIQVVDDSLHYSVLFAFFSYNHFSVIFIDNPNK